jgi:hypothetical protein
VRVVGSRLTNGSGEVSGAVLVMEEDESGEVDATS